MGGAAIMGEAGGFEGGTFPIDVRGLAEYLLIPNEGVPRLFLDKTPLGGGAINAASGSLLAATEGAGVEGPPVVLGIVGGGANGLATSAGSSPGKIQRFSFSS